MMPLPPADGPPVAPGMAANDQEDAGSAAIHVLLPLLYRPRPDMPQRVRRAIERSTRSARPDLAGRVRRAIARSERNHALLLWAVAAVVVLLLGGVALSVIKQADGATLSVINQDDDGRSGECVRRDDGGLRSEDGQPVPPGSRLAPPHVRWVWPVTGARFEITADAAVGRGMDPGELQLDRGAIIATVDPLQQRTPLSIRTAHAVATVVGTRFRIEADAQRTRLRVDHGTVSFVHDGREERIQAGGTASAPDAAEPGWELREASRVIITDRRLRELSGMVCDPLAPERLWTCGDHGNPATLFAIDHQGRVLETRAVAGAVNRDWEELALVRLGDRSWLAIGDIGKSRNGAPAAILLVAPQPPLTVARCIELRIPHGVVDMDCMAWDMVERAFYLVGKDGDHPLLRCPWGDDGPLTATVVGRVKACQPAALAIDATGTRMALLDEDGAITVFGRQTGAWDLARPRSHVRVRGMPVPQALAWDADGTGLWISGEGPGSPLIHMLLIVPGP